MYTIPCNSMGRDSERDSLSSGDEAECGRYQVDLCRLREVLRASAIDLRCVQNE